MSSSNKPSSLGTSDHWSTVYTQELENYRTNKAHRGDVWYGEEAEDDAVDWYCDLWDEYKCKGTTLDIGCGNGSMTVKLAKSGRLGKVTGSDYVQSSVDLTRQVLDDEGLSTVSVYTDDLRSSRWGSGKDGGLLGGVIDKGTMDALLLLPSNTAGMYYDGVNGMLEPGGIVLITSCNSSAEECRGWYEGEGKWEYLGDRSPNNTFTFGGVKGTTHFMVAFRKPPMSVE